jgi:TraM recognition site of TraD and TraG
MGIMRALKSKGGSAPRDPSFVSMVSAGDPWDLNFPLIDFGPYDHFTLRQALESVAIFGELGAAKTTGSAATFLLKYMEIGMGGLVCCVKSGERELIEAYAAATGRSDSLIIVSPKHKNFCNLLKYVQKRPGALGSRVEQIVSTLMTIVEAAERGERGKQETNPFWARAHRELLRNAIEVCIAAKGTVTMSMLNEVIESAPRSPEQVQDEKWQAGSLCYQLIEEADHIEKPHRQQADFELAARYFLREFAELPHETRGSILATYSVMANVLLRGHMADLFDGETSFLPEMSFGGSIIILDLPLKIYGQSGIYCQSAFVSLWQQACEQRDVKKNPRPTFMYIDEAHELVNNSAPEFLATARSARVATILISQNRPNYLAAMGGEAGRHRVDAFLGNMGTKIFHSNGDPETNKWASDMISEAVEIRMNYHGSRESNERSSSGGNETVGRKVLPSVFTQLRKGGQQSNFITESLIYQTGAAFHANNGEPWLRVNFKQQIPGVTMDAKGGRR